jgi:hypothetical protein
MLSRKQGIGQFTEKLLQQTRNAVVVVEKALGVRKVNLGRI